MGVDPTVSRHEIVLNVKALVGAFNQEKVQLHRLIDLRHYLGGRGRAQAGHRHRAEEGQGERLLGRGLRLALVRGLGDQLGEGGAQELGQVLGRLGLGHGLAQDTVGAGLDLGALGPGVRDDVLHGLLHRGHVAEAAVAPVVVAGLRVRGVRGLGVELETNPREVCISCIIMEKALRLKHFDNHLAHPL